MDGLHRHVCSNCNEVVINNQVHMDSGCPSCDDKYAAMIATPDPAHDKEIMEAPPDDFECPDCGSSLFALSNERGTDWMCRQTGGCGFGGWIRENEDIRPPNDFSEEEHARHNAWSRYHRYQEGHYDYRD